MTIIAKNVWCHKCERAHPIGLENCPLSSKGMLMTKLSTTEIKYAKLFAIAEQMLKDLPPEKREAYLKQLQKMKIELNLA